MRVHQLSCWKRDAESPNSQNWKLELIKCRPVSCHAFVHGPSSSAALSVHVLAHIWAATTPAPQSTPTLVLVHPSWSLPQFRDPRRPSLVCSQEAPNKNITLRMPRPVRWVTSAIWANRTVAIGSRPRRPFRVASSVAIFCCPG